ncbi:DNA replication ATP-dependent helicase/nuclease DNA2 isoform X2 [Lethenteron reissneri]|uniref:DNA replication ATP-dependent helicase/nuclease DNA2 isoform X2 n=1 Tax=Lethenteron reissneri TaxID=7753 RepID=UPI002AB7C722|nr:DNA replication ATP-dependent helicase/nuclease DNA2 isoform X2 [Lethenteron reissneri]
MSRLKRGARPTDKAEGVQKISAFFGKKPSGAAELSANATTTHGLCVQSKPGVGDGVGKASSSAPADDSDDDVVFIPHDEVLIPDTPERDCVPGTPVRVVGRRAAVVGRGAAGGCSVARAERQDGKATRLSKTKLKSVDSRVAVPLPGTSKRLAPSPDVELNTKRIRPTIQPTLSECVPIDSNAEPPAPAEQAQNPRSGREDSASSAVLITGKSDFSLQDGTEKENSQDAVNLQPLCPAWSSSVNLKPLCSALAEAEHSPEEGKHHPGQEARRKMKSGAVLSQLGPREDTNSAVVAAGAAADPLVRNRRRACVGASHVGGGVMSGGDDGGKGGDRRSVDDGDNGSGENSGGGNGDSRALSSDGNGKLGGESGGNVSGDRVVDSKGDGSANGDGHDGSGGGVGSGNVGSNGGGERCGDSGGGGGNRDIPKPPSHEAITRRELSQDFPEDELSPDILDAFLQESFTVEENSSEEKVAALQAPPRPERRRRGGELLCEGAYNRYRVAALRDVPLGAWRSERHLSLTANPSGGASLTCVLKDDWALAPVSVGDVLHLDGAVEVPPRGGEEGTGATAALLEVTSDAGFVVVNPDLLLSGTTVANGIRCPRRAVLSERFKGGGEWGTRQMLLGTLLHEVFQRAALQRDFSDAALRSAASTTLAQLQHLAEMCKLGVSQAELLGEMEEYFSAIGRWASRCLEGGPEPKSASDGLHMQIKMTGEADASACTVSVRHLGDVEESVWSPRFGLKGKVDAMATVRIHRRARCHANNRAAAAPPGKVHGRGNEEIVRTVPLELKTGKESNSIEHRAQVVLYTLLTQERWGDPGLGFLLYLKSGGMHPVSASRVDTRELIKLRNQLAHSLANGVWWPPGTAADGAGAGGRRKEEEDRQEPRPAPLPEPIAEMFTCRNCSQLGSCAVYHRAVEEEARGSSDAPASSSWPVEFVSLLAERTQHLGRAHLRYFSRWYLLCLLEAQTEQSKGGRHNLWVLSPHERQAQGLCVCDLTLLGPAVATPDGRFFTQRFRRRGPQGGWGAAGLTPDLEGQGSAPQGCVAVGDRVIVSGKDPATTAIATATVLSVTNHEIECQVDRDLGRFGAAFLFSLDVDESFSGSVDTHLGNLSRLLSNTPASAKLRELVIDLKRPEFLERLSDVLPVDAKATVAQILKGLNRPQRQAMKRVLLSRDYTLIVGMPGTGKTTTICTLVRILHACGHSVLLTSYTHSAVDNILLKLAPHCVPFLRLGRQAKVHAGVHAFTEEELCRQHDVRTPEQLQQLYDGQRVVATTCMGLRHAIFSRRVFDFCIVDEASQIGQPVCLGLLLHASRFVLVGDHHQLPPLVLNPRARAMGMDESLFKRLECHAEAVVYLNLQYRMNSEIMSLSNVLTYGGLLACGSERVSTCRLSLPALPALLHGMGGGDRSWMAQALDPDRPVLFLNTEQVPAEEMVDQGGMKNPTEAQLIAIIAASLVKAGCRTKDVGIISPYRQQLGVVSAALAALPCPASALAGLEINTVDKYQGRDKPVIIVGFVRSCATAGILGELLKDRRRLNVAVTRAKHKLLLLGCLPTLRLYTPLAALIDHMATQGMILDLPPGAHEMKIPDLG